MYSFVRGARLYVKGTRDPDDPDDVPDPGDQLVSSSQQQQTRNQMASASQESREVFRSAHVRSGVKTVHTSRVVRKTTTMTRGEQRTLEDEASSRQLAIESKRLRAESGTQTAREPVVSTSKSTSTRAVHRKTTATDTTDSRKKQKVRHVFDLASAVAGAGCHLDKTSYIWGESLLFTPYL